MSTKITAIAVRGILSQVERPSPQQASTLAGAELFESVLTFLTSHSRHSLVFPKFLLEPAGAQSRWSCAPWPRAPGCVLPHAA